jgi:hypothetical protein
MPIYLTVLYNPTTNTYVFDNIIFELEEAVQQINRFKDDCSIIIYEYNHNIELYNTTFACYKLIQSVSGTKATFNQIPKPMNNVLLAKKSQVLLFTS